MRSTLLYPYDIWPLVERGHRRCPAPEPVFLRPEFSGAQLPHLVQQAQLPANHDQRRAADRFPNRDSLLAWTALSYFQKGTTLLYAGQEVSAVLRPPRCLSGEPSTGPPGEDLSAPAAAAVRHQKRLPTDAVFHVDADDAQGIAVAFYQDGQHLAVGVFPWRAVRYRVRPPGRRQL